MIKFESTMANLNHIKSNLLFNKYELYFIFSQICKLLIVCTVNPSSFNVSLLYEMNMYKYGYTNAFKIV